MVPERVKQGYTVFVLDETTFSIQPKTSHGWFLKGSRPIQQFNYLRAQFHCFGAQGHHKNHYMFSEQINAKQFTKFLKRLKNQHKKLFIILDNAKWHKTKNIQNFCKENKIQTEFLPPYSPNLNPIEQWWKKIKNTTTNQLFYNKQQIKKHVNSQLKSKKNSPKMFQYLSP